MQIGPISILIFAVILFLPAYIIDYFLRRVWAGHPGLRLTLIILLLGIGLWVTSAHGLQDRYDLSAPQYLHGLFMTVPSVLLCLFAALFLRRKRSKAA